MNFLGSTARELYGAFGNVQQKKLGPSRAGRGSHPTAPARSKMERQRHGESSGGLPCGLSMTLEKLLFDLRSRKYDRT